MYLPTKGTLKKKKDQQRTYLVMLMRFFSDFLYKMHILWVLIAIQTVTHKLCLFKVQVDKKYTNCNLKTTELLDCALIGICAVIRSNMVLYVS